MNNLSSALYSPVPCAWRVGDVEWRFIVYSLLLSIGLCFFVSQVGLSDFSSLDEEHFAPFVVDQRLLVNGSNTGDAEEAVAKDAGLIPVYDYHRSVPFDVSVDLGRISELSRKDFIEMIVMATPQPLRRRIRRHIDVALDAAEKYQVDPFWVLAIMWTESHFNENAHSFVSAKGLMQIMPETGIELSRKLRFTKNPKVAVQLTMKPRYNVEMGTFYLKYLQRRFWQSPMLATVAYNMGPGWVKWRVLNNKHVGRRNHYLNKVTAAYHRLSSNFIRYTLNEPKAFTQTYVAMNPPKKPSRDGELAEISDISFL